jgi:hypothetical protein
MRSYTLSMRMALFLLKARSDSLVRRVQPTSKTAARRPEFHPRSWWIVHTQPTKQTAARRPESHEPHENSLIGSSCMARAYES